MTRDRALDAVNYESFKSFATSGARTENDPDVMEQFVLETIVGMTEPFSRSNAKMKAFCLNEYNWKATLDKMTHSHMFLGKMKDFLSDNNDLMAQWVEWLDPEGGLEL